MRESKTREREEKKREQPHSSAVFGVVQALGELLQSVLGKSQCRSLGRPPDKHQQSGRADTARCVGVHYTHKQHADLWTHTHTKDSKDTQIQSFIPKINISHLENVILKVKLIM